MQRPVRALQLLHAGDTFFNFDRKRLAVVSAVQAEIVRMRQVLLPSHNDTQLVWANCVIQLG